MADKAISVRLDTEARRALDWLISRGHTRSEAIRLALVQLAREERTEQIRLDAHRIGGDAADRAEVAEIRALMEELAPPG